MIYFLEDDDSIRDFVIYTLNSQGMEARGFGLPSEFWNAMADQVPSLVLLDVMLPEEDGLSVLKTSVQNSDNNHTRFICISKKLEIYPGADRTSLMMTLRHEPGSLYKVLSRFYALGINLNKLESRPLPERSFEFMFYFDLETSIYSEEFVQLMCELDEMCEEFKYLGSYTEVV